MVAWTIQLDSDLLKKIFRGVCGHMVPKARVKIKTRKYHLLSLFPRGKTKKK